MGALPFSVTGRARGLVGGRRGELQEGVLGYYVIITSLGFPQKHAASHADNFTFALVIPGMLRPSSKRIRFREIHLIYLI